MTQAEAIYYAVKAEHDPRVDYKALDLLRRASAAYDQELCDKKEHEQAEEAKTAEIIRRKCRDILSAEPTSIAGNSFTIGALHFRLVSPDCFSNEIRLTKPCQQCGGIMLSWPITSIRDLGVTIFGLDRWESHYCPTNTADEGQQERDGKRMVAALNWLFENFDRIQGEVL
jgi:hypothetical protein